MYGIFRRLLRADRYVLGTLLSLQIIGLLITMKISHSIGMRFSSFYLAILMKYVAFVVLSWVCFYGFYFVPRRRVFLLCLSLTVFALFLTYFTAFAGPKINGVRRWLFISRFCLQPSEFLKNLIIIPVVHLLEKSKHKSAMSLFLLSAVACLLQPDLGMTLLMAFSVGFAVLLRNEHLRKYMILCGIVTGLVCLSGVFLATYAKNRILIFIGNKRGYQVQQSLSSIANAPIFGSIEEQIYIPDSHCDFMFSTIVNQMGFLFGIGILFVPIILSRYVIRKDSSNLVLCLLWQFSVQFYLHVLSNIGFIPTKGLGLPFVSHGGSGMLSFGISFGILANLLKNY